MASKTEIVNLALTHLLEERLTDVDTEQTKPARTMKAIFDTSRDIVLASHPWNFAEALATIAKDTASPAFRWDYQYTLPSGGAVPYCLRALFIGEEGDRIPFRVRGRKLLTDERPPLYLTYTSRVTDPAIFSPPFVEALAAYLALTACKRLTGSTSLHKELRDLWRETVQGARFTDGAEGMGEGAPASTWEEARS